MLQTKPELSAFVILDYELRASPWAKLISWKWLQWVSGHYFAWKVRRKYTRYIASFIHVNNNEDQMNGKRDKNNVNML